MPRPFRLQPCAGLADQGAVRRARRRGGHHLLRPVRLRKIMKFILIAIGWGALCGCMNAGPNPSTPLPVSEALGAQEDRRVVVKGYLVFGSHARHLWRSEKAFRRGKVSSCLTLVETGPHRDVLTRNSNRLVVVTGRVRRDVTSGFVDYGACSKMGIAIESVSVGS